MRRLVLLTIASLCLTPAAHAVAANLHEIGSFNQPVYITSGPFNPDRLLIAEREGMVIEVTASGRKPLADLTEFVSCCDGERGLLSIAPAPDFESSGRFYAAYTGTLAAGSEEGDVHVDSFRPGSGESLIREPILTVAHSTHDNHNGGQLQFGPDGHLYISLGDGGGEGDKPGNAQNTESQLGKILRIDPKPGQAPSFTVPAGNPFAGKAGLDEVWAYGLRNPWRFSFDRLTGDMVIGDVGQNTREEVDFAPSPGGGVVGGGGDNYGWNCREGFIAYTDPGAACATVGDFTEPVFDYPHQDPGDGSAYGCAIIGGYVVRDPASAISTVAISTPTTAPGRSARFSCRRPPMARQAMIAPKSTSSPSRPLSARTPAVGSTSLPNLARCTASKGRRRQSARTQNRSRSACARTFAPPRCPYVGSGLAAGWP